MRFENKQFLQYVTARARRPAEFRKGLLGKRFVVHKSLPCPFRELRRFDVGGCIEQDDYAAVRQDFNEGPNEEELGFSQIVQRMKNDALKSLKPGNAPL